MTDILCDAAGRYLITSSRGDRSIRVYDGLTFVCERHIADISIGSIIMADDLLVVSSITAPFLRFWGAPEKLKRRGKAAIKAEARDDDINPLHISAVRNPYFCQAMLKGDCIAPATTLVKTGDDLDPLYNEVLWRWNRLYVRADCQRPKPVFSPTGRPVLPPTSPSILRPSAIPKSPKKSSKSEEIRLVPSRRAKARRHEQRRAYTARSSLTSDSDSYDDSRTNSPRDARNNDDMTYASEDYTSYYTSLTDTRTPRSPVTTARTAATSSNKSGDDQTPFLPLIDSTQQMLKNNQQYIRRLSGPASVVSAPLEMLKESEEEYESDGYSDTNTEESISLKSMSLSSKAAFNIPSTISAANVPGVSPMPPSALTPTDLTRPSGPTTAETRRRDRKRVYRDEKKIEIILRKKAVAEQPRHMHNQISNKFLRAHFSDDDSSDDESDGASDSSEDEDERADKFYLYKKKVYEWAEIQKKYKHVRKYTDLDSGERQEEGMDDTTCQALMSPDLNRLGGQYTSRSYDPSDRPYNIGVLAEFKTIPEGDDDDDSGDEEGHNYDRSHLPRIYHIKEAFGDDLVEV